jgi:predicted hotdog family 3-hydroxylacyl-ACP dehydratase
MVSYHGPSGSVIMYDIETLIPHRGAMKLIGEIIEIDESRCVTASIASESWPLVSGGSVDPIILIELAAQTAGVHFGWEEMRKGNPDVGKVGWIVGIKKAEFFRDRIPVGSRIEVSITDRKSDATYAEIAGTARIGTEIAGEIMLQVFRPESDAEQEGMP